MKDYHIKNIAIFLIALVILLPVHFSSAMAATVNSVTAYGSKGMAGYRALDDSTTINASVTANELTNMSGSNMKILEDPTQAFTCKQSGNTSGLYNCILTYPKSIIPSTLSVVPFTVQVFDNNGKAISPPFKSSISVDVLPPKVIGINYTAKPGGIVIADYEVKDFACSDSACSDKCSGISSLKFTVAGVSVGQNTSFGSGCTQAGKQNLTGLIVSGDVGKKRICIEVADKFDQKDTYCKDQMIDAKPPYVSGVALVDSSGKAVRYTNGKPINNVALVINITEHSRLLHPDSNIANIIRINASSLSDYSQYKAAYGSLQASCINLTSVNNSYMCTVGSLYLGVSTSRAVSIDIYARDDQGNNLSTSKTLSLSFDNTGPVATKWYSKFIDDKSVYWMNETNNSIYLDITESGAGMKNGYVYLDVSGLGPQRWIGTGSASAMLPYNCTSGGSGWTCQWVLDAKSVSDGGQWYAKLTGQSRDDANNALTTATGSFRVDKEAPDIIDINVTAIGELGKTNRISSGDALEIIAYIEDYTPVTAYANLTNILPSSSSNTYVKSNCSEFSTTNQTLSAYLDARRNDKSKRLWECMWTTGAIVSVPVTQTSVWTNTTFDVKAEDLFKYSSEHTETIRVLGKENVTGDYWDLTVKGQSPSKGLDRFIWGLGQPMSYQQISVARTAVGSANSARIISFVFDPTTCTGDNDYLYYSESGKAGVTYMGFDTDIADGLLDILLMEFNPTQVPPVNTTTENNETYPLTNLTVNCTATIISVLQDARVSMAEQENFTLVVDIYGNPLGQNIGNVRQEMEDIVRIVDNDWWGIIKYPKIILDYAQMICTVITTLQQINALWTLVTGGFGAACEATGYFCGPSGTANIQQGVQREAVKGMLAKFTTFCGLVISCRATEPQAIDGVDQEKLKETGEAECMGDSTWCKLQLAWSKWMTKTIDIFAGSWIFPKESTWGQKPVATDPKTHKAIGGKEVNYFNYQQMPLADKNALRSSFDPKKSLITSLITACLPGIFAGFDKYRQLLCEKLMCYKVNVAYGSMDMAQCDDLYAYGWCRYILGEIWNAIPFYQLINNWMSMIRDIIANPFSLAAYTIDIVCSKLCTSGKPGSGCSLCTAIEFVNVLSQVVANVKGLVSGDTWTAPLNDICSEALKDEPKYGNLQGFPPEADPAQSAPSPAASTTQPST